jgi:hypothetical protein
MKSGNRFWAVATMIVASSLCFTPGARAQTPPSCAFPTAIADESPVGYAEAAWKMFVAANCTAAGNQPTWQTWTEQTCFFQGNCGSGAQLMFHSSRLGMLSPSQLRRSRALKETNQCPSLPNYMTGAKGKPGDPCQPSPADPSLAPFVPGNLAPGAIFSEVVYVNPAEAALVKASLATLQKQADYSQTKPIDFPKDAIEIKADWIPATSLTPVFACGNPPAGVYVQQVGNTCYALAGVHISSKLLTNWLWATFEAQNITTNPNRCNPALYSSCIDEWGVTPAHVSQATAKTIPTKKLSDLFAGARGKFPAVLQDYRLTGVQTAFVSGSTPTMLGNSFTEFNAGVAPKQASCITCHNGAQVSTQGVASIGQFQGGFAVKLTGTPQVYLPPTGGGSWKTEDFSWMLSLVPAK